jgi:hypothetical protein
MGLEWGYTRRRWRPAPYRSKLLNPWAG